MRKIHWNALLGLLVVLCYCAGCAHQSVVETSQVKAPPWTLTPPPPSAGKVFFTGRSLAVNILDEKHGISEAIDDAAYQIAREAAAEVTGQVTIIDTRTGEAIRGQERTEQRSRDQVVVDVRAIVSGLRQEEVYWERWAVRERFGEEEFKRYKYWVLVSFPEAELKRLQDDVKKKLRRN